MHAHVSLASHDYLYNAYRDLVPMGMEVNCHIVEAIPQGVMNESSNILQET